MAACVPSLTVRSTVGLVASKDRVLRQIGSGTLLAVADRQFVVTAAHVARDASEVGATVGVSGTLDGNFVAAAGTWLLSGDPGQPTQDDRDVAVYPLSRSQGTRFDPTAFVRVGDVAFLADTSSGCFVVTGFPVMWSSSLTPEEVTMKSKMLQYGTFALAGSTAGLVGFAPERHFLLEATPEFLLDSGGQRTSLRTRTGHPAQMPNDLVGVSGCSVWKIGDFTRPFDTWSAREAKLVGVETSVYKQRRAIKVTRWASVASLLYVAVPETRRVLEMYEHMAQ